MDSLMTVLTPEIDVARLTEAVKTAATIVDVREPMEYVVGHVPGAVLIPMGELPGRLAELDKDGPVYVVCATGNRSASMTDFLRRAGYDAYSVAGGTADWSRSGGALVTGYSPRA